MADEMNTIQAELSVSIGSGQPQGKIPPPRPERLSPKPVIKSASARDKMRLYSWNTPL